MPCGRVIGFVSCQLFVRKSSTLADNEELEQVTLNEELAQSRPPEPVDARKSSTYESQLPMVAGEEILTSGLRGLSGARKVTVAESGSVSQPAHLEESCEHAALSFAPDAILMESPTRTRLFPEGYITSVAPSTQLHCANALPEENTD